MIEKSYMTLIHGVKYNFSFLSLTVVLHVAFVHGKRNTLAYLPFQSNIGKEISFMKLPAVVNVKKLFTVVSYDFSQ
jgi:hypothetical protein